MNSVNLAFNLLMEPLGNAIFSFIILYLIFEALLYITTKFIF